MNPGPPINSAVNTVRPGTDVEFECYAKPSTSRTLPMRSCKTEKIHYEIEESNSSDSNDEPDEETEQPNLNESTK